MLPTISPTYTLALDTVCLQVIFPEAHGSSLPGPEVQPYGPDVCAVLRTLLDLVDEHWNGQFSLHLNPNFMGMHPLPSEI